MIEVLKLLLVVSIVIKSNCFFYRSQVAFYGVYDGHGGTRASNFAASNLHNNLAQTFPKGNEVHDYLRVSNGHYFVFV